MKKLIAIVGPTASGKSALAVSLVERFGGEVVACDSTQVYRGFDIGTAKPTREERRGVPHHLVDLVEATELFTAAEYRRRALEVLAELHQRGRLPIFSAGTGLYLRALLAGLSDAPARSNALRARLNASAARRGETHLHRLLQRVDPAAAARISLQDRQKLVRALEIRFLAGKPLAEVYGTGRDSLAGYAPLKIGLNPPRALLYERIEKRVHAMLAQGWRAEVVELLASTRRSMNETAKPFEFIGYREMREHIERQKPLPETITAIAQATRRYAKRQITWFRKEPDMHWFSGFGDAREVTEAVSARVERYLAGEAVPLPADARET